ncbi:hypothetical protein PT974_08256 [Cladobotryum mycophilum]|uniref:Uncharacterized protein n=1 Tax=Cladobotryum mycophilum TaxID=491253 RepID=A0ABR0SCS8_9HYPO
MTIQSKCDDWLEALAGKLGGGIGDRRLRCCWRWRWKDGYDFAAIPDSDDPSPSQDVIQPVRRQEARSAECARCASRSKQPSLDFHRKGGNMVLQLVLLRVLMVYVV